MKLTLITGLDGSGKSTLINKLEKSSDSRRVAVLRVPTIDADLFKENEILYKTSCFINDLHIQADENKIPQLKVIAMFSAMLFFKELLNELKKNKPEYVFCERHPLVDTLVYAHFYSGNRMDPENVEKKIFIDFDNKYTDELGYLLSLLEIEPSDFSSSFTLLKFIHNNFTNNKLKSVDELNNIFKIGLPDEIFYLSANPETLVRRLIKREGEVKREIHENTEALKKMQPVYQNILDNLNAKITIVDAESFEKLDLAFEKLKAQFYNLSGI